MSYLELLWIPAVLGWLPLIYADEVAAFCARRPGRGPKKAGGQVAIENRNASDTQVQARSDV